MARKTKLLDKMHQRLNGEFSDQLATHMLTQFGVEVETRFDVFGTMRMYTVPVKKKKFTKQEHDAIKNFEDGYSAAMALVHEERIKR